MSFSQPHFTSNMIIHILLALSFPLLPVSADDTSTSCQYPCLPAPVVPVTNCPPPPPPPELLSPVTGYWSYPPPPPSGYYPYYTPPNGYNMNPAPPPPDPMLPWFPWYYHKSTTVSKGNSVFYQGSFAGSNVVLLSIFAIIIIL